MNDNAIPPIPFLATKGTAFERGQVIGSTCQTRIHRSLDTYERLFSVCDIPWHAATSKAQHYTEAVLALSSDYIDELKGIAKGASVEIEALMALNCRTEILPSDFLSRVMADEQKLQPGTSKNTSYEMVNECTSLAVTGANYNQWLAQNWDWCGLQRQALYVIEAKDTNNASYITVTEAGMLAKIGINSHGFAVTLNILRSDADGAKDGVPVHFLLRALLDRESVPDAIEFVSSLRFSSSSNIMVQDAEGAIASFELSPYGVRVLEATNGCLSHTNHFLHDDLVASDVGRPGNSSTINRLKCARQSVHADMSEEEIINLLCDQSDGLESICRFADPSLPDIAQIETVTAVIMDSVNKTLKVSGAQPSISTFQTYSLNDKL